MNKLLKLIFIFLFLPTLTFAEYKPLEITYNVYLKEDSAGLMLREGKPYTGVRYFLEGDSFLEYFKDGYYNGYSYNESSQCKFPAVFSKRMTPQRDITYKDYKKEEIGEYDDEDEDEKGIFINLGRRFIEICDGKVTRMAVFHAVKSHSVTEYLKDKNGFLKIPF